MGKHELIVRQNHTKQDGCIKRAKDAFENDLTVTLENGEIRRKTYDERSSLWLALWSACDFSWEGLADACWQLGKDASFSQHLKAWKAPASLPVAAPIHGVGDKAYKKVSLQEYWRYTQNFDGSWRDELETLQSLGLLTCDNGKTNFAAFDDSFDLSADNQASSHLSEMINKRLVAAGSLNTSGFITRCQFTGIRAKGIGKILRAFSSSPSDESNTLHLKMPLSCIEGINVNRLRFGNNAEFARSLFGERAEFTFAKFEEKADFSHALFGDTARFSSAQFGASAKFTSAQFGNGATFYKGIFGNSPEFKSTWFGNEAVFYRAKFGDFANFMRSRFGEELWFGSALFGAEAWFSSAELGDRCRFESSLFSEETSFDRVLFGSQASFANTDFKGNVSFEEAVWNGDEHYNSSFMGTRFRDVADFRTSNFSNFSIFDGAEFQRKLLLSEPSEGETPDSLFRRSLRAAQLKIGKAKGNNREAKNIIYGELSGGYRTTKAAMQREDDFERAQRYYRFEVQARMKKDSTNWPEKVAARFYGLFSDYGASIGRPFLGLAVTTFLFAGIYLSLSVVLGHSKMQTSALKNGVPFITIAPQEDAWKALEFSMNNAFRPLSALGRKEPLESAFPEVEKRELDVAEKLLFRSGGAFGVLIRFVTVIQSLMTLVLAFLLGLAIRRKFEIR